MCGTEGGERRLRAREHLGGQDAGAAGGRPRGAGNAQLLPAAGGQRRCSSSRRGRVACGRTASSHTAATHEQQRWRRGQSKADMRTSAVQTRACIAGGEPAACGGDSERTTCKRCRGEPGAQPGVHHRNNQSDRRVRSAPTPQNHPAGAAAAAEYLSWSPPRVPRRTPAALTGTSRGPAS